MIEPHAELSEILKQSRKSAGRFRITPSRHFVLELDKTTEGWRGVYLGKLLSPVRILARAVDPLPHREWQLGETYPLAHAFGNEFSVLWRDERLIAQKSKGGEIRFVPRLDTITDPSKRDALSQIQSAIKSAVTKGHRTSKIVVTSEGHVIYVWRNQALFLGNAPEGGEGFIFEDWANGS